MRCLECESREIREDLFCEACGRALHAPPSVPDETAGDDDAERCPGCGTTGPERSCRVCGEATVADRELCDVCGSTLVDVLQALHAESSRGALSVPSSQEAELFALAGRPSSPSLPDFEAPWLDDSTDQQQTLDAWWDAPPPQALPAIGDLLASMDAAVPPSATPPPLRDPAVERTLAHEPSLDTGTPEPVWALDAALPHEAGQPAPSPGDVLSDGRAARPPIHAPVPGATGEPSCEAAAALPGHTFGCCDAVRHNLAEQAVTGAMAGRRTHSAAVDSPDVPAEQPSGRWTTATTRSRPWRARPNAARLAPPHAARRTWKAPVLLGAATLATIVIVGRLAIQPRGAGDAAAGDRRADIAAIVGRSIAAAAKAPRATAPTTAAIRHGLPARAPSASYGAAGRPRPSQHAGGEAAVSASRSGASRASSYAAPRRRQIAGDRAAVVPAPAPRETPAPLAAEPVPLALALPAPPAPEPRGPVFQAAEVDVRPSIERRVEPQYPDQARERGIEEVIVVRVLVSPAGSPSDIRLLRRSTRDPAFDAAALAAVRQWRFAPARKGQQAVSCWFNVGIPFRVSSGG